MNTQKSRCFTVLPVILFLIYSVNVCAQAKGKDLLRSLQIKFNSLNNVSADFVQYTDGRKILSGKFYYQKENKIRINLNNDILVTDGVSTWNYDKKQNKVIINNYDSGSVSVLSLRSFIDVIPSKCSVKEKNGSGNAFVLIPDSSGISFKEAVIEVNPRDLIDNLSVLNGEGQNIKIVFSNYKLNQELPKTLFHLNAPKGSHIIDLR